MNEITHCNAGPDYCPQCEREALAAPEGYALVPVVPTQQMIEAGDEVEDLYKRGTPQTWGKVYRAMIAAAPQPAQPAREWIDLTPTEMNEAWVLAGHGDIEEFTKLIGAKLKEKNT